MTSGIMDAYARTPSRSSYRHLEKFTGNKSPERLFLAPYARQSAAYFFDDFLADTIDLNFYALGHTAGTNDTVHAKPGTDIASGVITAVTGSNTADAVTIRGYPHWLGDQNCWVEIRSQIDVSATNLQFEIGFLDTLSSLDASAVNDIDTPTFNAGLTDGGLLAIDTSQTYKTMELLSDGSTSNMNATAIALSPVFTPTNATFYTYTVGISGDYVFAMVDGLYLTATTTGVIGQRTEGGSLLRFWHCVKTRTTVAKTVDIDYIAAGQDRAVRVA